MVLGVPAFDEDSEALGHKLNLVAEAFDQHACVALDLFDPLVERIEAGSEPIFLPFKSLIKIVNKFLVHTTPAVSRIGWLAVFVNETRVAGKGIKRLFG